MSIQDKNTLKSFFETGDQPTESNFEDLIDSMFNLVEGLSWKQSVVAATTVDITLSGNQTIDGVSVLDGDRVLVKDQTTATENGIYVAMSGAWNRADDNNTGVEIANTNVFCEAGTVNGGTQWNCSNSSITLGSTNITFVKIAGAGAYTNGTGLSLTGNTFSIDSTVATLAGTQTLSNKIISASSISIPSTGASIDIYNTSDEVTNFEKLSLSKSSNIFSIASLKGGTGTVRDLQIMVGTSARLFTIKDAASIMYTFAGNTVGAGTSALGVTSVFNSSSGINNSLSLFSTINQSSTAGYRGLCISPYLQATGSGVKYLIDAGTNSAANGSGTHTSVLTLDSTGTAALSNTGLIQIYNTTDQTTNYERLVIDRSSNVFRIMSESGGSGTTRALSLMGGSGNRTLLIGATNSPLGFFNFAMGTATNNTNASAIGINGTVSNSSSVINAISVVPTFNQTGTAGSRAVWISQFDQGRGSGVNYLFDCGTNSAADGSGTHNSKFIIDNSGNVAVGAGLTVGTSVYITKPYSGATTSYGVRSEGTVQSDVTTSFRNFGSISYTAATSFTLPEYIHFFSGQGTIGAGSTLTNQYGFLASSGLTGATTNYGFYSNIPASGTARWGFYSNGDAPNHFAGSFSIGRVSTSAKFTVNSISEQTRIEYDVSNYMSTTVASNGSTTFALTGSTPEFTFSQMTRMTSGLSTASGSTNANFTTYSGTGISGNITQSELLFSGASTVRAKISSRGSTLATLSANDSYGSFVIGTQGFAEAGSGTHALGAQLVIKPITIGNGAATTTNTASIYVEDAGTAGTNNYAIWSDAGINRLDGNTGIGSVTTPNSTLQIAGSLALPYISKTTTYSITATDYTIDCASGTFTVTLPAASGISGRIYIIKNSGTGTITIDTTSSQTIDGSTTKVLNTQYTGCVLQSNGSNWLVIGLI